MVEYSILCAAIVAFRHCLVPSVYGFNFVSPRPCQTSSNGTTLPEFPTPVSLAKRADRLSRSEEVGPLPAATTVRSPGSGMSGGLGWLSPGCCNDVAISFVIPLCNPMESTNARGESSSNSVTGDDAACTMWRWRSLSWDKPGLPLPGSTTSRSPS